LFYDESEFEAAVWTYREVWRMQDRYVGDIGDFVKYGLLRALSPDLKLGVAWYLFPDEKESRDGKHLDYLGDPNRWRPRDPELFDEMKRIVTKGQRSVAAVENSELFEGVKFYTKVQSSDLRNLAQRKAWRSGWFSDLLQELKNCDLVFADPDNGLYLPDDQSLGQRRQWKRLPLEEARSMANGRTAVLYHHNTRWKGGHNSEVDHWVEKLGPTTLALRWRAYSARTFFVVNPTKVIAARLKKFAEEWGPEARLHAPTQRNSRMTSSTPLKRDEGVHAAREARRSEKAVEPGTLKGKPTPNECPFCTSHRQVLAKNECAFAILDSYPVSEGHCLIIPTHHVPSLFDLSPQEYGQCFDLVREVKSLIEKRYGTASINVGVNNGLVAGQTIDHAHIHVIPRYEGDVDDPRGGVRHVIPGKGFY
jgi:diadenosine tetraphosphate (Ap4A) HIT family hydrolase